MSKVWYKNELLKTLTCTYAIHIIFGNFYLKNLLASLAHSPHEFRACMARFARKIGRVKGTRSDDHRAASRSDIFRNFGLKLSKHLLLMKLLNLNFI